MKKKCSIQQSAEICRAHQSSAETSRAQDCCAACARSSVSLFLKDRAQELLHLLPRLLISLGIVPQREVELLPESGRIGVGEAVDGSGIVDEPEINIGIRHLLFERLDLLHGNELVVSAVEYDDLRLDHAGLRRFDRCKASVKTCNTLEVHALPCHVEDNASAEAVADSSDALRVNGRLFLQKVHGCQEPGPGNIEVLHELAGEFSGVIGVHGLFAVSVHVNGKRSISQLRQHPGTLAGKLVMPPPFMDNEDPQLLALDGVIIGKVAFHHHALGSVVYRLALDLCISGRQSRCQDHKHHTDQTCKYLFHYHYLLHLKFTPH